MNAYEKMHQAVLALDAWVKVIKSNPKDETAIECAEFVEETIKAAIAEPPRNCDVGTAMEQGERFSAYCRAHKHPESECLHCPLFGQTGGYCELAWAQMPYKEGGVK